ncbi:MAG TPA: metallophosphoesterase [Syntrophorhabdaceae bacterium]|nr:metallophosphoesterase [Syntrophorhabdaceae bacterium]HOL05483.1 metallophosphoesterase [Syntrophorhabdaceae bacterium]HPP42093.1 metallophosphoesterase [Syntrophorhabdaceae bacterium]HQK46369.1 metallophosphoesterase [Syntrophorhabdaceae bacterium]
MSWFLISFFSIYSLMHLYMYIKVSRAFHFPAFVYFTLALFMVLMIIAPVVVRMSEKAGYETWALISAYTGYIWMAFIFLFFILHLFFDIISLFIHLAGLILQKDFSYMSSAHRVYLFIVFAVCTCVVAYGYYEAGNIKAETVTIKSGKIPKEIGRIRLAQISDVHAGIIVDEKRMKKITDIIKSHQPDILVSTGDLVDRRLNSSNNKSFYLEDIRPRFGKFAVLGNHEFYAGIKDAIRFTEKQGFKILRGEAVDVQGIIIIAGIDDPAGIPFDYVEVSERGLLSALPGDRFIVLLKHQPYIDESAKPYLDLQLSGHTHGGQIYPFRYITRMFYPYPSGLKALSGGRYLYVSRGTGTWGPPVRFLAPPEVTIIDIVAE